ncbi:MAG: DUF655 domain-containing protein [Nitrososphaerota archaeon]|nr:DUF655 domain-containing protein [Nitrososphaerota archaeon]
MMNYSAPVKRYEEYAYVLDYMQRSRSKLVKNREGLIVQVVGEEYLTLLELLALDTATFGMGERIYIGKDRREKIVSVLGKLNFDDLPPGAKQELQSVLEQMVQAKEQKYVAYFNNLQPITPRLHSLELIPGIGRTLTVGILDQREKKPFETFADVEKRGGLKDPGKQIAKRLYSEIAGQERINIFVKR